MIITNNIYDKRHKTGRLISCKASHYHDCEKEIVIYLPDVLEHSKTDDSTIEHILTQHIAHETLHKVIDKYVDSVACDRLDNICSQKQIKIEGNCSLKNWFGGLWCQNDF